MAKRPVPKYDFKAFGVAIKAAREGAVPAMPCREGQSGNRGAAGRVKREGMKGHSVCVR